MMDASLPLTRSSALERLAEFAPNAGTAYASRRNLVAASGDHQAVSRLSAALRRRLVSEREVVGAALAEHPYEACEAFIAEVFWRTYWKGWLEHHPSVWSATLHAADEARSQLDGCKSQKDIYVSALAGRTGIEAFDHWARELSETGYLHNWARMQVASIWTFTLGLPWQLGAAWMFERLVDADPASNTLSWRWVCGLHTAGKTYLADPDRITRMTGGMLHGDGLATTARPPERQVSAPSAPLRSTIAPDTKKPSILLLTPEDLSLEAELTLTDVRAVVVPRSLASNTADRIAMEDGLRRATNRWRCPSAELDRPDQLVALVNEHGAVQVVTGYLPVGPVANRLGPLRSQLEDRGLALTEHLRTWDKLAWPHCAKGFFHLKARIPSLLAEQGFLPDSGEPSS